MVRKRKLVRDLQAGLKEIADIMDGKTEPRRVHDLRAAEASGVSSRNLDQIARTAKLRKVAIAKLRTMPKPSSVEERDPIEMPERKKIDARRTIAKKP